MSRRLAVLIAAAALAAPLAAPAAVLAQAANPFQPLPQVPVAQPTATTSSSKNSDPNAGLSKKTELVILLLGAGVFGAIVYFIRRDLRSNGPGERGHGSRDDRRAKNPGPHQQPVQQRAQAKARARAKAKKARRQRKANRR